MKFSLPLLGVCLGLLIGCSNRNRPPVQSNPTLSPPPVVSAEPAAPVAAEPESKGIKEMRSIIPLDDPNGVKSRAENYYLILDDSSSMNDRPPYDASSPKQFRSKLEGARWALKEYVRILPQTAHVGLATLNNGNYQEQLRLTSVSEAGFMAHFDALVDSIGANGNTPLGGAIKFGTDKLVEQYKRQLGFGQYKLVLITDGADNGNVPLYEAAAYKNYYGMPLITIGYALGSDHALRQYGEYSSANSVSELRESLKSTAAESQTFDPTSSFEGL